MKVEENPEKNMGNSWRTIGFYRKTYGKLPNQMEVYSLEKSTMHGGLSGHV